MWDVEAWSFVDICFSSKISSKTHTIVWLRLPDFSVKIWGVICTQGPSSQKYLFFYRKYEPESVSGRNYLFFYRKYVAQHILESCPGRDTYFSPKILAKTYTIGPADYNFLFSHLKYETEHLSGVYMVKNTSFFTQNMRRNIYMRPGRLLLPVFPHKIWDEISIWSLYNPKNLFFYPKYETYYVPQTWLGVYSL